MQETVKQNRDRYIGGSDIPIIMNLSPFKSRYDLLLEKAGYKEDTFSGNAFTEYGNVMEEKIRNHINSTRKVPFLEGQKIIERDIIGYRAHTDGETEDEILEIKTTSEIHETLGEYKIYLVQLLFYMMIEEKDRGTLAVYERPYDLSEEFDVSRLHIYEVKAEEWLSLAEEVTEAEKKFIEDLKKVKDNPFIEESELLPAEIPEIAKNILAFEEQLSLMKKTEERIKSEKARLKAAMERAGVKSWKTPNGYRITLVEDGMDRVEEKTTFDEKSFKSDLPEIYMKYSKTEKKLIKGRAGYVKITAPKGGDEE